MPATTPKRPTPREMASWSEPQLRAYMKKLQDAGEDFSKFGFYAEATGDLSTGDVKGGLNHHSKSPFAGNRLKRKAEVSLAPDWKLPPPVKRTDVARVESMAKRLFDTIQKEPWQAELILRDIQLEYWKQGKPIAYDDLKTVASTYIKRAAEKG